MSQENSFTVTNASTTNSLKTTTEIQGIARLKVHTGKLEKFPELVKTLEGTPVRLFSPHQSL